MKVLKPGKLSDTFKCTCHLCNAILEYTNSDIINAGPLQPFYGRGTHNDYTGNVQINKNWPKLVKYIILSHYSEYTEEGLSMKRKGHIICPECKTRIELEPIGVPLEVYPDKAIDDNGDLNYDMCKELVTNVWILKEHIESVKEE